MATPTFPSDVERTEPAAADAAEPSAPIGKQELLSLSNKLGYRPLQQAHGKLYLLTSVKPEHAELFPGCSIREYQPEQITAPEKKRLEVEWRPPAA